MSGMIRIYDKAKPVFTGCGKDGYPEEIFIERSAGGIYTDCVFSFAEFESEIDSSDDTEDDVALGKAEFINCTIKHRKGGC